MYAVIEQGGKQYRVELGTELAVDRMPVQAGETVEFERVLLVADGDESAIGRPLVAGARVSADVLRQARGDKIVVFKYRPKARSRVKQGARADLTILRISDIVHGDRSAAGEVAAQQASEAREAEAAAAAAAKQAEADKVLAAQLAKAAKAAEKPAGAGARGAAKAGAETKAAAKEPTATKPKTSAPPKPKVAAAGKPTTPTKPTTPAKPASRTQAPAPEASAKPPARKKKDA
jgi:large subunit ribosomal protein L21